MAGERFCAPSVVVAPAGAGHEGNGGETGGLADIIEDAEKIRDELKITILLIEHDMGLVMKVSEMITVIDYGQKIAQGNAEEVQNNSRVIEAYLGREEDEVA